MDHSVKVIMENMLSVDKNIFMDYFDESHLVGADLNSPVRQRAENLFKTYSSDDFDTFMLQIYDTISFLKPTFEKLQERLMDHEATASSSPRLNDSTSQSIPTQPIHQNETINQSTSYSPSCSKNSTIREDKSTQTDFHEHKSTQTSFHEDKSTQTNFHDEMVNNQSASANVSTQTREQNSRSLKKKENFRVLNFLLNNRFNKNNLLRFQSDDDILDDLKIGCPFTKKNERTLKEIAEKINILNNIVNFKLLNVQIEKYNC